MTNYYEWSLAGLGAGCVVISGSRRARPLPLLLDDFKEMDQAVLFTGSPELPQRVLL